MLVAVRSKGCLTIELFAQDSNFSRRDEELLSDEFDIRVLHHPEAEQRVSQHSFAFAATKGCEEGDMLAQCEHRLPRLHLGLGFGHSIYQDSLRVDDMAR